MISITDHPFISLKRPIRMVGDEPKFDIFISYRVASDTHHADVLYNRLTQEGYRVWWDAKCLEPGQDWKEGFCEGIVNSKTFMCLLSKEAINHPTKEWQNFFKLTKSSKCDNVFLEHRLALELKQFGLIESVFPIMIGDYDNNIKAIKIMNFFRLPVYPIRGLTL